MGGEEQKGVWRFILVTSFVKNAESNGRIWQVVFPSPPGWSDENLLPLVK